MLSKNLLTTKSKKYKKTDSSGDIFKRWSKMSELYNFLPNENENIITKDIYYKEKKITWEIHLVQNVIQ